MTCEDLKSLVLKWLDRGIECTATGPGSLAAVLPILAPNGDAIEIGITSAEDGRWRISDMGETYASLFLAGVELSDEYVRAEEFKQIIRSYQIADNQQELSVEASQEDLVDRMFDLAHAMQAALALQLTLRPSQPASDFPSVVAKFLAEHRASFEIPPEPIEGKSGRWNFNFVLNHVRKETLVKTLSANSQASAMRSAERSIFEINDVRAMRETDAIVITDDEGDKRVVWKPRVFRIFREYQVPVYSFHSNQQELVQLAETYSNIKL